MFAAGKAVSVQTGNLLDATVSTLAVPIVLTSRRGLFRQFSPAAWNTIPFKSWLKSRATESTLAVVIFDAFWCLVHFFFLAYTRFFLFGSFLFVFAAATGHAIPLKSRLK
jgi:hypothetical protein